MYVYVYTYTHLYINKKLATLRLHLWFVHAGKYTMDNHWFQSLFRILNSKADDQHCFFSMWLCCTKDWIDENSDLSTSDHTMTPVISSTLATPCCRRHNLVRIPYHFKDCYVLYSSMVTAKLSPRHRCAKHAAPLDRLPKDESCMKEAPPHSAGPGQ